MKQVYLKTGLVLSAILILIISLNCVKSSTGSGPGPGPGPGPNTISIGDNFFSPAVDTFTLSSGSVTVNWKNNGGSVHTATSDDGTSFNTGDISPGQTKSIVFTVVGTYPYHCIHHGGMNGTVVIQ